MGALKDLTGRRFGRLVVLGRGKTINKKVYWEVVCDCGTVKEVIGENLNIGTTISCGCYRKEITSKVNLIHGEGRENKKTPEYRTWRGMITRCTYNKGDDAKDYIGRGITMCDRWSDFSNFLADMGRKPSPKHSLDRIDNDGNYEPSNCKWATPKEQSRNQRSNVWYEYDGRKMIQEDWAKELEISANMFRHYLKTMSLEEIIKKYTKPLKRNPYEHLLAGNELKDQLDRINLKYTPR